MSGNTDAGDNTYAYQPLNDKILSGTPKYNEADIRKWNLTTSECFTCHTKVPHSQLFACQRSSCPHSLMSFSFEKIHTTTDFFNRGRFFCGNCAFVGMHSSHSKSMHAAEPMAIEYCADVMAEIFKDQYDELRVINDRHLIDHMMAPHFESFELPDIEFREFLASSNDASEFMEKVELIMETQRQVTRCRNQGTAEIEALAEATLCKYQSMVFITSNDSESDEDDEETDESSAESENHQSDNVSSKLSSGSDSESVYSEDSDRSDDEAADSSAATTVIFNEDYSDKENDEKNVKEIYSSLVQRYDSIRDGMVNEVALVDIANFLNSIDARPEHKKEAADLFKLNTNMSLKYQLEEKS